MAIRPTFMGFESAARGMMNSQKSLDIVLNNIANMDTTGYTRQRVDLVSNTLNFRNTRYHNPGAAMAGQGASISGVSQMRDPFLDRRFREEYSDVGYYSQKSSILTDVASAIDEIEPDPLSAVLTAFEVSWDELAKVGGNHEVAASGILAQARSLTQVLQQMSSKLNNVVEQQYYSLNIDVDTVNTTLHKIAELNDAIKKEKGAEIFSNSYYGPNELMDQRNVLIDQLSGYGDISVKEMPDGTVEVSMAGKVVVKDDEYDQMNLTQSQDDKTVSIVWNSTGKAITPISGSLFSSIEMINGRGTEGSIARGENFERGLPYYKDKIDHLAKTIAKEFNNLIEIADADGNSFVPPQYKTLFTFEDPTSPSAGGIRINPQWAGKASYLYEGAKEQIAEGVETTTFIGRAKDILTKKQLDFGEYTGTLSGYISFYTTTMLGSDIENANSRLESCTDVTDSLQQRIFSISGVARDEEAAHAMQYQKAYEAVSRIMTVMDDLLDKLINGTGRAGL